MDIYSAQSSITRVRDFVDTLTQNNRKMYRKTVKRLQDIESTCMQIVESIHTVLQLEDLKADTEYTAKAEAEQDVPQILEEIKSMLQSVQALYTQSNTNLNNETITSMESSDSKQKLELDDISRSIDMPKSKLDTQGASSSVSPEVCNDNESSGTGRSEKSAIFKEYKDCILSLQDNKLSVVHADRCKHMLQLWFNNRFIWTKRTHKEFRYNLKSIPESIKKIVTFYGNAIRDHHDQESYQWFCDWCNGLLNENTYTNYILPYDVYKLDISKEVSLISVVLWDLLMDMGLRSVCHKPYDDGYYVPPGTMRMACLGNGTDDMNHYIDYKTESSILQKCGLFQESGEYKDV